MCNRVASEITYHIFTVIYKTDVLMKKKILVSASFYYCYYYCYF